MRSHSLTTRDPNFMSSTALAQRSPRGALRTLFAGMIAYAGDWRPPLLGSYLNCYDFRKRGGPSWAMMSMS
jgi:hypothetical protein